MRWLPRFLLSTSSAMWVLDILGFSIELDFYSIELRLGAVFCSFVLFCCTFFWCSIVRYGYTHTLSLTHKSSRTQHRFHYIECAHLTLTALTYSLTDSASQLVYFKYTHYMHAPMNCFSYEPGRCQRHLHVHRVLTKQYYYNIIAWCNVAETSTNIWRIRVLNGFCVHLPLHYCPFFGILK